jgi:predicted lipoprotein with Yx(FWY)xxD motif
MQQSIAVRLPRAAIAVALLAIVAGALLGAGGADAKSAKRVVAQAHSPSLGKTVLTNTKHHTLYSLSVEKNGKFICTGSCLQTWHPLIVPPGVKPTGPVKLGTVKRPNGGRQVTYHGRPLYTFDGDMAKGETNGEGFKDVGTWHAATTG